MKSLRVEIVNIESGEVSAVIGKCLSEKQAERRLITGMSKINTDKFFVRDVEEGAEEQGESPAITTNTGSTSPAEAENKRKNSDIPNCKTCMHKDATGRAALCKYNYTAGSDGCRALRRYL